MRLFDRFPARYLVPNAVTCVGLVVGLASIRTSLTATSLVELSPAAWFILYAVLLDKVDGAVALGVPDPWSHGVAHAALLGVGALYAVAAAVRLAKFNVTTASVGSRFFLGLPSTSSGGILASAFLAHRANDLSLASVAGFVAFMAVNALLMVCNLPQPKLHISSQPALKALQIAVVLSVYVLIPLHLAPTYLVAVSTTYTVVGFIYGLSVTGGRHPGEVEPEPTK